MVSDMKMIIQAAILLAAAISLNSCGVAEVLGRTAGRVMESVGNSAGNVMTNGSL
jgi:hypothetical protein